MSDRPRKVIIPLFHPREGNGLSIVGDGAIANPAAAEGRLVPVVILDTTNRPDIDELIRLHQFTSAGDVKVQWGSRSGNQGILRLVLTFLRPSELVAIVEFDLNKNQGVLVENVLASRSLYIQSGRVGDRVKNTMGRPRVVIEVPDTGFGVAWDKIYFKHSVARMRSEGLNRAEAKRAARQFVDTQRSHLKSMRVPIK